MSREGKLELTEEPRLEQPWLKEFQKEFRPAKRSRIATGGPGAKGKGNPPTPL